MLNLQGDVVGLLNETGEEIAVYNYTAWGEILGITDKDGDAITSSSTHIANLNPLRYRGYYYDTETGWYYLRSRYYDPATHRYLSSDSVFDYDVGFQGYNLYAYCGSSPVYRIDINGRDSGPLDDHLDILDEKLMDGGGKDGASGRVNSPPSSPLNGSMSGMGGAGSGYNGGSSSSSKRREEENQSQSARGANSTHQFGTTSPKNVSNPNGYYTQIDSKGEIYSYTMFNKDGNQVIRFDFKGSAHNGIIPHIHVYGYNSNGFRDYKVVYDMDFNRID